MIMWRIQLQNFRDKKCVYGTRLAKNPIRLLHVNQVQPHVPTWPIVYVIRYLNQQLALLEQIRYLILIIKWFWPSGKWVLAGAFTQGSILFGHLIVPY